MASSESTASSGVSAQVRNCNASSAGTRSPLESICRTLRANLALADIGQPSYLVCFFASCVLLRYARLEAYHESVTANPAVSLCNLTTVFGNMLI